MPAPKKFTDQQLREAQRKFAGQPDAIAKIADLLGTHPKTIQNRLSQLEKDVAAPRAIAVVNAAEANVWDIRNGLQRNFDRLERLLNQIEEHGVVMETKDGEEIMVKDHDALIKALETGRKYQETALKAMESYYRVEETRAFMEDVLGVLAEVDPELRARVLERIRARKSMRAAFVPE